MPSPEEAPVFKEKEGQYRIYVMLPFDASRNFEIYQGELDGKAQMESESYGEQTWEYLTVVSGATTERKRNFSLLSNQCPAIHSKADRSCWFITIGYGSQMSQQEKSSE